MRSLSHSNRAGTWVPGFRQLAAPALVVLLALVSIAGLWAAAAEKPPGVAAFANASVGARGSSPVSTAAPSDVLILSIVGTSDLHGAIFPRNGRGGLALLGGYLQNLRAARAADEGGVLLLDAGDTFQGGMESNLTEGAVVVDAYGALGYTAAAIGNHEFDFGSVDAPVPHAVRSGDPRGALKAIAARASYPLLAANLVDERTGELVEWPNVRPSVLVTIAGVRVGIVGVMTSVAMRATLAANVKGLRTSPLVEAIRTQASALRASGAQVVVVTAHAGGRCARFDAPDDLSSCEGESEIFEVARQLPPGLVDAIVAGHAHAGVAHRVAGIPIVEPFSGGRSFGRIDLAFDRASKRVVADSIFAPQDLCEEVDPATGRCDGEAERAAPWVPATYEGRAVAADPRVNAAMAPQLQRVAEMRATGLPVVLDTPMRREGDLESPLGNLFADALRASVPEADVAITNNNAIGGLRADISEGPLTFGRLYDVFPFDNRVVTVQLTGHELRQVLATEVARGRRGALGVSGIRVHVACDADGRVSVALRRASGEVVDPAVRLTIVTTDFLAGGSVFGPTFGPTPVDVPHEAPIVREVVSDWLRARGGHVSAAQFTDDRARRWEQSPAVNATCAAP